MTMNSCFIFFLRSVWAAQGPPGIRRLLIYMAFRSSLCWRKFVFCLRSTGFQVVWWCSSNKRSLHLGDTSKCQDLLFKTEVRYCFLLVCFFFSCDFLSLDTQLHKRSYSMWHLVPAPKAEACTWIVFPPPQPPALQIHPLWPYCSSPEFILPFSIA